MKRLKQKRDFLLDMHYTHRGERERDREEVYKMNTITKNNKKKMHALPLLDIKIINDWKMCYSKKKEKEKEI